MSKLPYKAILFLPQRHLIEGFEGEFDTLVGEIIRGKDEKYHCTGARIVNDPLQLRTLAAGTENAKQFIGSEGTPNIYRLVSYPNGKKYLTPMPKSAPERVLLEATVLYVRDQTGVREIEVKQQVEERSLYVGYGSW